MKSVYYLLFLLNPESINDLIIGNSEGFIFFGKLFNSKKRNSTNSLSSISSSPLYSVHMKVVITLYTSSPCGYL
jgi:hypothetical protein